MVIVKWSYKLEELVDNIYNPLFSGLYKEEDESLVNWSGGKRDAKIN